ncbi:MAG: hypothetical protein GXO21_04585 [Aquificae bacterium]|nr:hypothetical protein [Aquificota bacterium]
MNILKLAFSILLKPKDFLQKDFIEKLSYSFTLRYMLTLALIGPILSFYSMFIIENISIGKTILYCITTYVLDIICVYIFAYILSFFEKEGNFFTFFKITVFSSTAIWISDIVDIHQILRPLSSLGLLYSLYLLYIAFKNFSIPSKRILAYISLFVILYILNALVAESIVQNPLVAKILKEI